MSARESVHSEHHTFLPWMFGSQSCEKIFRAARSMTTTFSTVINFSLLGLLRRLNRLHIQLSLEAVTEETGIKYPRSQAHYVKDGLGMPSECFVKSVTNQQIGDAVMRGRERAQAMVQELGMADLLQKQMLGKSTSSSASSGPQ